MKISTNKNVPHLSKNKLHPLNNNPSPTPRKHHFANLNIQKGSPHLSPNAGIYTRNEEALFVNNGGREIMSRSPQNIRQNQIVFKQDNLGLTQGVHNLKGLTTKTNQLHQNEKYVFQFQNQYETIPTLIRNNHKTITNLLTDNRINTLNLQSPNVIYTTYETPKNIYNNRELISQFSSRYQSQRNSHNNNQLAPNVSIGKSNQSIGKSIHSIGKNSLSKTKLLSASSNRGQFKMNKLASHPLGLKNSSNQRINFTSRNQLTPLDSSKSNKSQHNNQIPLNNNHKGGPLRLKIRKYTNRTHQFNENEIDAENQYFGNQLNTVISTGVSPRAVSPRGVSPRTQSKKKTNFLRLSKSLQNTSLKQKINLEPTKITKIINFDKMYDHQDFKNKYPLRQEDHYHNNQKYSLANSEQEMNKLTEMESELKKKKKNIVRPSSNQAKLVAVKTNLNRDALTYSNQFEDQKTRLKIPSFQNSLNTKEDYRIRMGVNGSFQTNPPYQTTNAQYMIETRNISQRAQKQPQMINPNNLNFKPAQTSVMKNSQFLVKPALVPDPIKNKITFNKSPQNKNTLKVINFNPKCAPSQVQVSKSLERPQTFNDPNKHLFQTKISANQGQTPTLIVRPHSSMSQFAPVHPKVQIRFENHPNTIVNQKGNFISINRGSSLSPEEQPRRPHSQSVRPLQRMQSSNFVQNSSGNSKFGGTPSQNMSSHFLQVNSTIKYQSVDNNLQHTNIYNQGNVQVVSQQQDQNKMQNNIQMNPGNNFYNLKSKNSNVMPSVTPSHELSSIIMGMKSYKVNNSYFNELKNQQNPSGLAYHDGKGQGKSPQIKGNVSKPSSVSSKGQSGMVEYTLPIDSKPNSPQNYIFGAGSESLHNNMKQNQMNSQVMNWNQSQVQNVRSVNQPQLSRDYMRNKPTQGPVIQHIQQNIQSEVYKKIQSLKGENLVVKINQSEMRSVKNSKESYEQKGQHRLQLQNGQRFTYTNEEYQNYTNQIMVNSSNSPNNKFINNSNNTLSHTNSHFHNPNHHRNDNPNQNRGTVPINSQKDNQGKSQQWLNINRQKYSTSEYLNVDQMNKRLQSIHPPTLPNIQPIHTQPKIHSFNTQNQPFLQQIRQTKREHLKQTYQNRTLTPQSYDHPHQYYQDRFYHVQKQKTPNHLLTLTQQNHNSQLSESLLLNNTHSQIPSLNQSNYPLFHRIPDQRQIDKIKLIENQQHQFRNKINSISQTLLSMTPINIAEYHQYPHISPSSPIQSNTQNFQENQVDRTKQYSQIQSIGNYYEKSQLQNVQYEYSQDQSSNQDRFGNQDNFSKQHSKGSSVFSLNKDLSDTRKITHVYGNTAKKSQNKMKNRNSKLNPHQLSASNSSNHLQYINKGARQPGNDTNRLQVGNQMMGNYNGQQLDESGHNRFEKPACYEQKQTQYVNRAQNNMINKNSNRLTDSSKKQIDGQGKVLYTPIQSSQIIQLSSLNSLSFNFVATNYQPSKNLYRQGSLLTLSKGHMQSSKNLDTQEKLTRSNKVSKKLITQPIEEQQSLYRPIPYTKHKHQTEYSLENKHQTESFLENKHQTESFLEKSSQDFNPIVHRPSTPEKNRSRLSPYNQRLKESQYGIAEDSVNYIPIERFQSNQEVSTVHKIDDQEKKRDRSMNEKKLNEDSISHVQYYESRYEYPSEEFINRKSQKQHGQGYLNFESHYLNTLEGEASFSNVIQTMNFNHYQPHQSSHFQ